MHLLWVKRVHFYLQGDGVLGVTRADAGSRPYKLFLFCRLFFLGGCLRGRGLCGGGVQNGLLFGYGLVQLVHAGLGGIAGGKQVRVFAVGVQRGLGLFQCALGLGQIRVCLIHGRLRVNALLCAAQLGFGGRCGVIGDTALQQGARRLRRAVPTCLC